jgi:hypothetical protein
MNLFYIVCSFLLLSYKRLTGGSSGLDWSSICPLGAEMAGPYFGSSSSFVTVLMLGASDRYCSAFATQAEQYHGFPFGCGQCHDASDILFAETDNLARDMDCLLLSVDTINENYGLRSSYLVAVFSYLLVLVPFTLFVLLVSYGLFFYSSIKKTMEFIPLFGIYSWKNLKMLCHVKNLFVGLMFDGFGYQTNFYVLTDIYSITSLCKKSYISDLKLMMLTTSKCPVNCLTHQSSSGKNIVHSEKNVGMSYYKNSFTSSNYLSVEFSYFINQHSFEKNFYYSGKNSLSDVNTTYTKLLSSNTNKEEVNQVCSGKNYNYSEKNIGMNSSNLINLDLTDNFNKPSFILSRSNFSNTNLVSSNLNLDQNCSGKNLIISEKNTGMIHLTIESNNDLDTYCDKSNQYSFEKNFNISEKNTTSNLCIFCRDGQRKLVTIYVPDDITVLKMKQVIIQKVKCYTMSDKFYTYSKMLHDKDMLVDYDLNCREIIVKISLLGGADPTEPKIDLEKLILEEEEEEVMIPTTSRKTETTMSVTTTAITKPTVSTTADTKSTVTTTTTKVVKKTPVITSTSVTSGVTTTGVTTTGVTTTGVTTTGVTTSATTKKTLISVSAGEKKIIDDMSVMKQMIELQQQQISLQNQQMLELQKQNQLFQESFLNMKSHSDVARKLDFSDDTKTSQSTSSTSMPSTGTMASFSIFSPTKAKYSERNNSEMYYSDLKEAKELAAKNDDTPNKPAVISHIGPPKVIKLNANGEVVKVFTGEQQNQYFKDWIKHFEAVIEPYQPTKEDKLVTLRSFLSPKIIHLLSKMPAESRNTYKMLKRTLIAEYVKSEGSASENLDRFIKCTQHPNESVNTYSSRLQSLREEVEIEDDVSFEKIMRDTFLRGLLLNIQIPTRTNINPSTSLDDIQRTAVKIENDLKLSDSSQKRFNKNDDTVKCRLCKTNPVVGNYKYCSKCYDSSKKTNTNNSPNSNQKPKHAASGTNANAPDGKPEQADWTADFSKVQVPWMRYDDKSSNPLLWSKDKLKAEKKCFYCGKSLSGDHNCRAEYPNYFPVEVRTLLSKSIAVPKRTSLPEGRRKDIKKSTLSFGNDKLLTDMQIEHKDAQILTHKVMIDTAGISSITYAAYYDLGFVEADLIPKPCSIKAFGAGANGPTVLITHAALMNLLIDQIAYQVTFLVTDFISKDVNILLGYLDLQEITWSKPNPNEDYLLLGKKQLTKFYFTKQKLSCSVIQDCSENLSNSSITVEGTLTSDINCSGKNLELSDTSNVNTTASSNTVDTNLSFDTSNFNTTASSNTENTNLTIDILSDTSNVNTTASSSTVDKIYFENLSSSTTDIDENLSSSCLFNDEPIHSEEKKLTNSVSTINNDDTEFLCLETFDMEVDNTDAVITDSDDIENHDLEFPVTSPTINFEKTVADKLAQSTFMNADEIAQVTALLDKWKPLFADDDTLCGISTQTKCYVPLIDESMRPLRFPPYRISPSLKIQLKKMLEEMLEKNVIRKSASPWAFPVVMATKSDGSLRFCVDYSKLTQFVVRDSYAIPRVDDCFDYLTEAKFMTVVDLFSGFWQIPLAEKDKQKLAFITPFGNYEWNVMPFGYSNAPSIFQRAIAETLDPYLLKFVLIYIDDIILYSKTFNEHLQHIDDVFKLLATFKWKIKLSKCQFVKNEVKYLGHKVGNGLIAPLDSNIDKLKNMKKPNNKDDMLAIFGLAGYYKRFIQDYDYIIAPLRKCSHEWDWTAEVEESYQKLLQRLSDYPVLRLPDFEKPFLVKTDCSQYAWGASLYQVIEYIEHPIQFASGTLNKTQQNWATWKREGYAVLRAMLKWEYYLLGKKFTLITDHKALVYILNPNKTHPPIITNWIMLLSRFDYTVEHRPGKELYFEDSLSRSNFDSEKNITNSEKNEKIVLETLVMDITSIVDEQRNDPVLSIIKEMLLQENKDADKVKELTEILKKLNTSLDRFIVENDILYFLEIKHKNRNFKRIALPILKLNEVLESYHKHPLSGHLSLERFWFKVANDFWCPNLYTSVINYHRNCHECAMNTTIKKFNSEMKHVIAQKPLEILEVDHIEVNVNSNGFKYILSIVDVFSSKVWWLPARTTSATETMELLMNYIFLPQDFCDYFLTDHGTSFDNALNDMICKAANITKNYNLANKKEHKGTTGAVENKNKLCWNILKKYVNRVTQDDWSIYVYYAASAYNKSPHPSLLEYSPNEIYYGVKPKSIISFIEAKYEPNYATLDEYLKLHISKIEETQNLIIKAREKMILKMDNARKEYLNRREIVKYEIGDYVIVKKLDNWKIKDLNPKLNYKNAGPFKIITIDETKNHVSLEITAGDIREFHFDDIKKYTIAIEEKPTEFRAGLKEIILIQQIPDSPKNELQKFETNKVKNTFNIKSIVGRRISVYWPSFKDWNAGIVIGYDCKMKYNLIYYDDIKDQNVPKSDSYFKACLFATSDNSRVENWKLLKASVGMKSRLI